MTALKFKTTLILEKPTYSQNSQRQDTSLKAPPTGGPIADAKAQTLRSIHPQYEYTIPSYCGSNDEP